AQGIHVTIDPHERLVPGATYQLRIGDKLADLGGETATPAIYEMYPTDGTGRGAIKQAFRTRVDGDPDAEIARIDTQNTMDLVHPMIGSVSAAMLPSVIATELGAPT